MVNTCGICKHGHETKPGGQSGPARHCLDCKKAKMTKPSGEAPQIGHSWCEKKHAEIGKQRNMECFEN